MKKRIVTLLSLGLVCLFVLTPRLLIWLGIREPLPPPKEVAKIVYTTYGTFDYKMEQTVLDLEDGKIWIYRGTRGEFTGPQKDPVAEGYTLACDMTPKQLQLARKTCQDCELECLQERYSNPGVMDGTHWQMVIYYVGGTEQWCIGRMAWPDRIVQLKNLAVELTGDPDCF